MLRRLFLRLLTSYFCIGIAVKPVCGFFLVFLHAISEHINDCTLMHGVRMSLIGRFFIPVESSCGIFRCAKTFVIYFAAHELSFPVSFRCKVELYVEDAFIILFIKGILRIVRPSRPFLLHIVRHAVDKLKLIGGLFGFLIPHHGFIKVGIYSPA